MNQTIEVYGIKNCSTVRNALKWLKSHQLEANFIDLKTATLSKEQVELWLEQIDSKQLVNRRGLTWRKLDEADKKRADTAEVVDLIIQQPMLLKRPLVLCQDSWSVGFNADDWQQRFL